ncbi:MAG: HK97 gp10 family phage protein [Anaerovoracaceae bacterium]|uniref:HK97 gp10 family phage protein n=1 Tax=Chryseobacterium sp. TaxID=1871047 RepID=UPI002FC5D523
MGTNFDVSELSEFGKEIVNIATNEMPKITKSFMKSEARKLKNKAIRKAKSTLKTKTGNYIDGFDIGKKVYAYGDSEYNIQVKNTAPHAHLIEYGYNNAIPTFKNKKKQIKNLNGGKVVGFTKGKHILENSNLEFESQFHSHVEKNLLTKVVKEMEK